MLLSGVNQTSIISFPIPKCFCIKKTANLLVPRGSGNCPAALSICSFGKTRKKKTGGVRDVPTSNEEKRFSLPGLGSLSLKLALSWRCILIAVCGADGTKSSCCSPIHRQRLRDADRKVRVVIIYLALALLAFQNKPLFRSRISYVLE
jgi:hypothetical protein